MLQDGQFFEAKWSIVQQRDQHLDIDAHLQAQVLDHLVSQQLTVEPLEDLPVNSMLFSAHCGI